MSIHSPVRLLIAPGGSPPTRLAAAALCLPLIAFPAAVMPSLGAAAGYLAGSAIRRLVPQYDVPPRWYEIPTACLWSVVAVAWQAGALPWWWTPAIAFLAWLLVPLTIIDLHHRRLPDRLTLPAAPLSLALLTFAAAASDANLLLDALLGAIALTAFYGLVRVANPEAIGLGDVKLAPTLGLFLGVGGPNLILLGPLIASSLTLVLHCVRHPSWRNRIPYGPGLLVSTFALALPAFA
ncbi:leader peptidase (prepilin peptidase)/N-methyltransferase [Actinokineospora baliensis]|uniref:prepilin peptidase n=1 Tax=Actinokineospora baliensis TaxID=547056 RepID=UPI00195CC90E|nr:A24 family peptidase [Actinokineospora baliensis]MBM7772949.1 leader peptidase (prepilin peptidase)/N-methyltransferase [Actinokineospora baliensis]